MNSFVDLTKQTAPKKFAVMIGRDIELSFQVQQYLFDKIGAVWGGDKVIRRYPDLGVLFLSWSPDLDCHLMAYADEGYWDKVQNEYPLAKLNTEMKIHLNQILVAAETIEIDGKKYNKEAVLKALEGLEVS